jgi:thioredoxin 1
MLGPVLERIANSRADFDVAKINIDDSQTLAMKYGIEVVPTMLIFKEGKPVSKIVGYADEDKIVNEVSKFM